MSSRITRVQGSHPWQCPDFSYENLPCFVLFQPLLTCRYKQREKTTGAVLPYGYWSSLNLPLILFPRELVWQFTVPEWLFWVFFLSFIIQALLTLLLFVSLLLCCVQVAWAVWFSPVCFAAAVAAVGWEAAALLGRVRCRGTHKQAVAAVQKVQKGGEIAVK